MTAALLYLLALLALFILAYRMKCSGQYYEDAMKFADDYQEARNRAKKGQAKSSAKKRPLRRTFVKYRGGGAKAVFYRQYLEAKKSRGFLFGSRTVWALFVAVFVTWMICREGSVLETLRNMGDFRFYVIPLGLLYYIILFSGQQNRWSKERENPYIFLIPDRPFKKLWYADVDGTCGKCGERRDYYSAFKHRAASAAVVSSDLSSFFCSHGGGKTLCRCDL